jgi:DNA-binding LacI/PurR family transcriptional regulator
MLISMNDVATRAGVSRATVSHALAPKLQVLAVVAACGCQPGSVVAQPTYELGGAFLSDFEVPSQAPRKVVLEPVLHIRQSCAPGRTLAGATLSGTTLFEIGAAQPKTHLRTGQRRG